MEELFDLNQDPQEEHNIANEKYEISSDFTKQIIEWIKSVDSRARF